jgi:hypothetical protein
MVIGLDFLHENKAQLDIIGPSILLRCTQMIKTKYDKQDQQGKAAFNERNPHMTQQQEPVARSPGGPKTKTGQGKPLVYEGWTWTGTPTLNAEQSLEDENITTLIACTGRLFTAATRHKQHGCEPKI